MPTPRQRTCGPERPRGPVTNFLALSPRATGKRFGSARRISSAVHAIPRAPLPLPSVLLVPPHAHSASLFHAGPRTPFHCPRWSCSTHGVFLFFFRVPTPFLAGRSFFLLASRCAARHARPYARTLASAHTDDRRPTDERRDVRSAGVADWETARRGNTERTLTAAAGPSPRDPDRHALAMRPSLKARPLVS